MLFSSSGSSTVRNRRLIVVEQEEFQERPDSSTSGRWSSLSGRTSRGAHSCPEYIRLIADSPSKDSPAFRSRSSSRSNSRTEVLRPGHWTTVSPQVRLRALSASEQRRAFEAQKNERSANDLTCDTNSGETTLVNSMPNALKEALPEVHGAPSYCLIATNVHISASCEAGSIVQSFQETAVVDRSRSIHSKAFLSGRFLSYEHWWPYLVYSKLCARFKNLPKSWQICNWHFVR